MAKEFTRKIRDTVLTGDRKEPFYTNKELDLLADKEDAYIRLKREYHCLTDNIKQIHSPDDSIIIDKYDKNNANISVEVGGVNLLDGSNKVTLEPVRPNWNIISYENDIFSGRIGVIEIGEKNATIVTTFIDEVEFSKKFSKDYVASCEILVDRDTNVNFNVTRGAKQYHNTNIPKDKWTKIYNTNLKEIGLYSNKALEVGTVVKVRNFKIERGTVATDWSPSLNDMKKYVDDQFDKLTDTFNQFRYQYNDDKEKLNDKLSNLDSRVSALERG